MGNPDRSHSRLQPALQGCWAAEYGKESTLGFETLSRVVKEGKAVGTFMYIFSGGEPLVCKKDIIRLCEENPDCAFFCLHERHAG